MRNQLLAVIGISFLAGCQPEIGRPCDNDPEIAKKLVDPDPEANILRRDPTQIFDCEEPYCGSVRGSRGFCTKPCESDLDCAEANVGVDEGNPYFVCGTLINFGPLACSDYEEKQSCINPDGTPRAKTAIQYCLPAGEDPQKLREYDENVLGFTAEDFKTWW